MSAMTMRERMLAVVQGTGPDRVPFCQYLNQAPHEEVWAELGRDRVGLLRWVACCRIAAPNCAEEWSEIEQGGLKGYRVVMHMPSGDLTCVKLLEPAMGTAATREHFVKAVDDYALLIEYLRDCEVRDNLEELARVTEELGEDGLIHASVPRTPFQQLWVQWVNIQDLCLHMLDAPDVMEEVTDLMGGILRRAMAIAATSPAPYIVFPDNITAPIIGQRYFSEYCVPFYRELAGMLGPGRPLYVHMDGDLKPIWSEIGGSGVGGLDSFSPPPDNDTSVAEALQMWPGMRLGVNFPSSVHLASEDRIYAAAAELLEQGGRSGRLQIQISENVPPGRWRVSYPQIVRAIDDFFGV